MGESSLAGLTVEQLLDRMADTAPGPSAGSSAGIAVAMAAALAAKTARLSMRKLGDAEELAGEADRLRARAVHLAQADLEAVLDMLGGREDPAAVDVPDQIGHTARRVAQIAERLYAEGNRRLRADAFAAVQLARAAGATVGSILESNAGQ